MKKLLLALCVFASCTAPESRPGSKELRRVEPAAADQTSVARSIETPAEKSVSESEVAKVSDKPAKKLNQTNPPASSGVESTVSESRQEQKIADSIQNAQQGSGSDMEGYIPFIKQFYDR